MPDYAPIIVSVYNRYDHLKRCIEALRQNPLAKESDLFILSDAPFCEAHTEKIEEIRTYSRNIEGFKTVTPFFREKNKGAHNSITEGIRTVLERYDTFIFLEDDIVVSNDFLQYMNEGLAYYQKEETVFSICGYKMPFPLPENYRKDIFFYPCNSPWGFGCWKDRWMKVNLEYFNRYSEIKVRREMRKFTSIGFFIKGILQADSRKEINATDLRVYYHMFRHNLCSVFPVVSKTQNWGFDGTGEHCGNKNYEWCKPPLDTSHDATRFEPFSGYDRQILMNYRRFQEKINGGVIAKYLKYTWIHDCYKKIRKRR